MFQDKVLVTPRETHQRKLVVRDLDGQLKPNFISVCNGKSKLSTWKYIRGNESLGGVALKTGILLAEDQKLKKIEDLAINWLTTFHEKFQPEHMARAGVIALSLVRVKFEEKACSSLACK